jgi:hypothetical protein
LFIQDVELNIRRNIYDVLISCEIPETRYLLRVFVCLLCMGRSRISAFKFFFNPMFVTICPKTFSNLCVESVRGM